MDLNAARKDALIELINIGYGRAGAALSELTRERVLLNVPEIGLHAVEQLPAVLSRSLGEQITCVNQIFTGPVAGTATLLLECSAAGALSELLEGAEGPKGSPAFSPEVIVETGNILLNACLGVFGNLLKVQVSFAVPRLEIGSVKNLLASMTVDWEPLSHALVVRTQFKLRNTDVTGYMLLIFSVTSLERLMEKVDAWATNIK